jgi:hypothetical protein
MLISPDYHILNEADKQPFLPLKGASQFPAFKKYEKEKEKYLLLSHKIDFKEVDMDDILTNYIRYKIDEKDEYVESEAYLRQQDIDNYWMDDIDNLEGLDRVLNDPDIEEYIQKLLESIREESSDSIDKLIPDFYQALVKNLLTLSDNETELQYTLNDSRPGIHEVYLGMISSMPKYVIDFKDIIIIQGVKVSVFDSLKALQYSKDLPYENSIDNILMNTLYNDILKDFETEPYFSDAVEFANYFKQQTKPFYISFYSDNSDKSFGVFWEINSDTRLRQIKEMVMESAIESGLISKLEDEDFDF